jgi:GTP-binding protein
MQFCDYAKIFIESGKGGNGCISFRREKNIPFGGPDGGHGGVGGSVFLRTSRDLTTLIDFRFRPHYKGKSGAGGAGRNRAGLGGDDLYLDVPLGTEIWVDDVLMVDLIHMDQTVMVAKGGLGGRGNASFVSSTNRAPREFTPGELGVSLTIQLRLKLLADVGFIGLPNAGKSTLLGTITSACPKIGPYPFTTLTPQLGTMITPNYDEWVLADLPGLVEGAHEGKGLGHRFLGHGERCRMILHVIDGTSPDLPAVYATVRNELENYSPSFLSKKELIVVTKTDLMSEEQKDLAKQAFGKEILMVSAVCKDNLPALEQKLWQILSTSPSGDKVAQG